MHPNPPSNPRNEQKELCCCVRPTSDMMMLPSLPMPPPSSPAIHASCSNDSRLSVRRAPDWPHRHRLDLCAPSAWDCLRFSSLTLLWPALSVFGWSAPCTLHPAPAPRHSKVEGGQRGWVDCTSWAARQLLQACTCENIGNQNAAAQGHDNSQAIRKSRQRTRLPD
jgi:hypothetical protein